MGGDKAALTDARRAWVLPTRLLNARLLALQVSAAMVWAPSGARGAARRVEQVVEKAAQSALGGAVGEGALAGVAQQDPVAGLEAGLSPPLATELPVPEGRDA